MTNENDKGTGMLFILDGLNGRILLLNTDSGALKTLVEDCGGTPDGIAVDPIRKHMYWTNMGYQYDANDGFIERADLDGGNRTIIVPPGHTHTPKQCKLDVVNGHLYWCDREGMRVMRSNMDGSAITTLYQSGRTETDRLDETRHCVGIAVDIPGNRFYWTQKGPSDGGKGRIFSAPLHPERILTPYDEGVTLLADGLPEPIDLDIHPPSNELYWTDRGNLPGGNSVSKLSLSASPSVQYQQLVSGLKEGIGLALDAPRSRMFFSDLSGTVYTSSLSGDNFTTVLKYPGSFTGIAFVEI